MAATKSTVLGKTCSAGGASKLELLMRVSDILVISRLKILKGISMEFMEHTNEDV